MIDSSEKNIFAAQNNLANTYRCLGRLDEVLRVRQEVYSGRLKLLGEEHGQTISAANNYAISLLELNRRKEAKALLRETTPVARRAFGDDNHITIKLRFNYARTLYRDPSATLDDLREAVNTLEETARTARRVFGGAHPIAETIKNQLREARAALAARET